MITVRAIKCPNCKEIIYSRCRHDFHWCSCETVAIDGGRDYTKISFKTKEPPEILDIDVNATEKQLYDDWNSRKNKFGSIKGK